MATPSMGNMGDMAALSPPPPPPSPPPPPPPPNCPPTTDATPTPASSASCGTQEAATAVANSDVETPLSVIEETSSSRKRPRSDDDAGERDGEQDAEQYGEEIGTEMEVDTVLEQEDDETESEIEIEFEAIDEPDENENDSDQEQKTNDDDRNNSSSADQTFSLELLAPTHWNTDQTRSAFGTQGPTQANQKASSSPGSHKPVVELVEDEALMRAVVALEPQFADISVPRKPLWESIATGSDGRFVSGGAARMRMNWLHDVVKDRTHREHERLSSALKTMVRAFKKARKNDDPVQMRKARRQSAKASPKAPAATAQSEAVETVVGTEGERAKDNGLATLNTAQEEAFMVVALKYVEALAQSERREKVWDQIVLDAGGRFEFGSQARSRLMWLLKIVKTPEHREHKQLTPKLKEMLTKFQSFEPFQRARGKGSAKPSPKSVKQKKGGHTPVNKEKPASQAAAKASEKKKTSADTWLTIQPEMDELLLHLVIEERPFESDRYQKPVVWAEIAQAVNNPRIKDGTSGQGRCRWLASVFENSSHDEQANLTPKLRVLLPVYLKIYNSYVEKKALSKKAGTESSQETRVEGKDSSDKPSSETRRKTSNGEVVKRLSRKDSALLREVLMVRPFHKNDEKRESLWQNVADNLMATLGSAKSPPTGESCHAKTGELLRMLHNPVEAAQFQLSEHESEMVRLLDSMHKTRWMHLKRLQTDSHRLLTEKIEEFLVRTQPKPPSTTADDDTSSKPKTPPTRQKPAPVVTNEEPEVAPQESESEPEDREQVREDRELLHEDPQGVDEDREELPDELEEYLQAVESSRRQRREERAAEEETKHEAASDSDGDDTRAHKRRRRSRETHSHHSRRSVPATSLVLDEDQIHALQAEIVRLRSLCALSEADRKSFTARIQIMQGEVESCRDQLTVQVNKLEGERREHRQELRAMVVMMQTERETHQRETKAMLEGINREREDRKNEFVAMMNLVTRSALPPSAS